MLLIAGPCVLENETTPLQIAQTAQQLCDKVGLTYVFKASWKKANRTSIESFTGLPFAQTLEIFQRIKETVGCPILTDIHECAEVQPLAPYVDYFQIPAFLCRQTDLLIEAGRTGKYVNIKKGQFSSPESMRFAVEKVLSTGNNKILLTERGTTFGYQDLVVDFRSIPIMQRNNVPVIMDCTHSLQKPNQASGITGGDPDLIEIIAKAAIAVGADGLFIETHPHPAQALSDGANMLHLEKLEELLIKCKKIYDLVHSF